MKTFNYGAKHVEHYIVVTTGFCEFITCLNSESELLITLTVQGGCIHGSPSICMGRALTVLRTGRSNYKISLY